MSANTPPLSVGLSMNKLVLAINNWEPIKMMVDEGLPEQEIRVISQVVAETLDGQPRINRSDSIVDLLEEFLISVLDEYQIVLDDGVLREFAMIIIGVHNRSLH
ncbi:hypothetical protein NEHOM01_1542 [Nematocida homosporus]|uniref:uncharacterized protein n=1 Tax=Nematocida homosporus TaxID=1912981 RepID=UPI00221FB5A1|nr:uncharacterized protein NEHOM01_1542 [Nematocida homosporus]KAI5186556.1 hypothetical protein NEHOM01_1542 [Nematocida homosporus]